MIGIEFVDELLLERMRIYSSKKIVECPELYRVLAANCKCDTMDELIKICEEHIQKKKDFIRELQNKLNKENYGKRETKDEIKK